MTSLTVRTGRFEWARIRSNQYSKAELAALPDEVHTVLNEPFKYDPYSTKVLAANGTTHVYFGCLGGVEVTVAIQVLLGNWSIPVATPLIEKGLCQLNG